MDLEQRITRLEDIEAIRCLQAKYQRCLDSRDFDGLGECFTPDAVSSYGNNSMSYVGRDRIIDFLSGVMTFQMPSTHLIHGGEIDRRDETHAEGIWYLEDFLLHRKFCVKLHGAAIYHVEYRKDDGVWRICSIGYERCYEYVEPRGLVNLLTLKKMTLFQKMKDKNEQDLGEYGRRFRERCAKKGKKK